MKLPHWLFLVFLILKLCHFIEWSWWWVTSPIWIFFIILVISETCKEIKKQNK